MHSISVCKCVCTCGRDIHMTGTAPCIVCAHLAQAAKSHAKAPVTPTNPTPNPPILSPSQHYLELRDTLCSCEAHGMRSEHTKTNPTLTRAEDMAHTRRDTDAAVTSSTRSAPKRGSSTVARAAPPELDTHRYSPGDADARARLRPDTPAICSANGVGGGGRMPKHDQ